MTMNGQRQPITDSMISDYMQYQRCLESNPTSVHENSRVGGASYQPQPPDGSFYANSTAMNASNALPHTMQNSHNVSKVERMHQKH